ncbi:glycosyltransferase family 4 protein [Cytobacillus firmus]|uniref:glycosyltransferase family 4 protein n=1 Tax=Cytobacillus firmus TaxID=1399 RepID=UPI0024948112|nr:glycosyltransferase family 4 protein [Cytobacillus firmus]
MKIVIATVQVPFIKGGAENLAANLRKELIGRGFEVEIVAIPFKWYPTNCLVDMMKVARLIDLTEVNGTPIDLLIGLKFPAFHAKHENKVIWMLHQHRQAYELWGTQYSDLHNAKNGEAVRKQIISNDNEHIREAKKVFTISKTVSDRLQKYNNIPSTPLYHPPSNFKQLHSNDFQDYIFCPSRIDGFKRQHILVEALKYTKTPVKVLLAGKGSGGYQKKIKEMVERNSLGKKVFLLGWISEEEKIKYYSNALAVYNGPYEEDYGYVSLEAFFSGKPVITHIDSGGTKEFVRNNINGFVVEPNPVAVAEKLDYFYQNKQKAKQMGWNGQDLIKKMNISWDYVIERLIK